MREQILNRSREEMKEVREESEMMQLKVADVDISTDLQLNLEKHAKKAEWSITASEKYALSLILLTKAIKLTTGTEPHMEDLMNNYLLDDYDTLFPSSTIIQIAYGMLDGIDMLYYASDFSPLELREIRLGLKDGLDVATYAKFNEEPYFDWRQMREIRLGLKDGLDVSYYDVAELSATTMRQFRHLLKTGYEGIVKKMTPYDGLWESEWGPLLNTIVDIVEQWSIPESTMLEYIVDHRYAPNELYGIVNGLVNHPNVDPTLYTIPGLGFYGMRVIQEIAETSVGVNGYEDIKKIMDDIRGLISPAILTYPAV